MAIGLAHTPPEVIAQAMHQLASPPDAVSPAYLAALTAYLHEERLEGLSLITEKPRRQ